jgi:hypothetical protein
MALKGNIISLGELKRASAFLRVFPNPWAARDKDGVPCGVCPRDVEKDGGGRASFVGARIDPQHTKVLQELAETEIRKPQQRTRYQFMGLAADDPQLREKMLALEPIELPETRYYKDQIAQGALLAADAATAAKARIKEFTPRQPLAKPEEVPPASFNGVEFPGSVDIKAAHARLNEASASDDAQSSRQPQRSKKSKANAQ